VRYMLLIYVDPEASPQGDTEVPKWAALSEEMAAAGVILGGDPLEGAETATTVRVRGGQQLTTDGPFAETKELLGGYYMIDVDDLDQALSWAAKMPNLTYGSVEVRPIRDFP
jgi:hypothetical protein